MWASCPNSLKTICVFFSTARVVVIIMIIMIIIIIIIIIIMLTVRA